jgi:hypothetical protein
MKKAIVALARRLAVIMHRIKPTNTGVGLSLIAHTEISGTFQAPGL